MQLNSNYRIVILSPHLDDAAFSCGGLIIQAGTVNAYVCVVSLFTEATVRPPSFAKVLSGRLAQKLEVGWTQGKQRMYGFKSSGRERPLPLDGCNFQMQYKGRAVLSIVGTTVWCC